MKKLRKPVYFACGYNTISLGTGRSEFHPKKPRPGLEEYIKEAGQGVIAQISDAKHIDEGIISNFIAARFNRQAHLAAMIPMIDKALVHKPCSRVEGACASGGLALSNAVRSVLAETADVVLVIGVEVQNTVKAIYGADYLAAAGHYKAERKNGHAYFFPGKFSDRAGAYYEKFGEEAARKAMAHWYVQAIENARTCENAQEFENKASDLLSLGMKSPNPKGFVDHLNLFDCSKVSDGASAIICASEEGLQKLGIAKDKAVQVIGVGQSEDDLTQAPEDLTRLTTTQDAVQKAYNMAGISAEKVGVIELHDCFSITGILALEAAGFAAHGKGGDIVINGDTKRGGKMPVNTTGGLVGYGHPTGATGIRQMIDVCNQVTGQAGNSQIDMTNERPYGLTINMGGNDRTVVSMVVKKVE